MGRYCIKQLYRGEVECLRLVFLDLLCRMDDCLLRVEECLVGKGMEEKKIGLSPWS